MGWPTFDSGFSTPELNDIFSPQARVAAMLEFEEALAMALGETGLAPAAEAEVVARACRELAVDPIPILESTWETGTPILALRETISTAIDNEAARRWFHYGATTQDAVDTGQMIQTGAALSHLEEMLTALARRLRDLTVEFADQPHMARTFLQDALPSTFGFRTAGWLEAVLDHIEGLRRQRGRLCVQLGGPVGTLGDYGDAAMAVRGAVAERLSLSTTDVTWHSNRSRVLELAHAVEGAALIMSKMGIDIALLCSSPIAEISVRSGGSSSMTAKRNPIDSIRAKAASHACSGAVSMLGAASELDRGVGGWHVEWIALPMVMQTCGAAIEAMRGCLDSLEVDRKRMTANVGDTGPMAPGARAQIDAATARFHRLVG